MEQAAKINNKKKIVWISILQGLTMLLVVIGHSDLNEKGTIPAIGFVYQLFKSFRMPLFILISGYLFGLTRISKNKEYGFVVVDKLKRLGIPFLFFSVIGFVTKYISSAYVKNPLGDMSFGYVLDIFLGLETSPLGALWFVYVTFMLMLLYPFYSWVLKHKYISILVLLGGIVLNLHPIPVDLFMINRVSRLFIYFFAGLLIEKYDLAKYAKADIKRVIILIALYLAAFLSVYFELLPIPYLILSFCGIVMSFHIAKYAEVFYSKLFNSFRYNTYQIYLISVFPQMLFEMIYRQIGSHFFLLFYIINILVGLYFPIFIVKVVEKYNLKYLKPCIGLL